MKKLFLLPIFMIVTAVYSQEGEVAMKYQMMRQKIQDLKLVTLHHPGRLCLDLKI